MPPRISAPFPDSSTRLSCPSTPALPLYRWGRTLGQKHEQAVKWRSFPVANINEMSGNCRSRSHRRRYQMGPTLEALTAFKVAVRSRRATLVRAEAIIVHREAHRAAGLAPIEARLDEDLVEAFGFRLRFHEARAGDDHGVDGRRDLLAL